jgi:hypothetical protein
MALFTNNTRTEAREGAIANSAGKVIIPAVTNGAMKAGLLCELDDVSSVGNIVKAIAAIPADDADSIVETPVASAASEFTIDHGDADGAIGPGLIHPCQRISITLNSHADWDATTASLVYETAGGGVVVEDVAVPDGGNTVLYSKWGALRFIRMVFPAQSGTNGTVIIGTENETAYIEFDRSRYIGVVVYDPAVEPYAAATEFADEAVVSVMTRGFFWAVSESAGNAGDAVFVRNTLSGSDVRGQFSADMADNFSRLRGATWYTDVAQDGLGVIELK